MARIGITEMLSVKFGYIDLEGNEIIEPKFADAKDFSEGYAAVRMIKDGPWGLIDKSGNVIIDGVFDKISSVENGYAVYEINGNYGFIKQKK